MKKELTRTIQCAKCPWKVSTNPLEIPGGYTVDKHCNLRDTIARPGDYNLSDTLKVMACHHSPNGKEEYCVGWLWNQLGRGNNIALRLKMRHYTNVSDIEVVGEQHQSFEDTLPKSF